MWYPGLAPGSCSWAKCLALWLRANGGGRMPAGPWNRSAAGPRESWEMTKIKELEAWLDAQHSSNDVRTN